MRPSDLIRLFSLGAIWGASFPLMRVAAPAFGSFWTPAIRLFLAGGLITLWMLSRRRPLHWRLEWRHYAVIGFLNSALPFALFSYAAQHIPAAYSAVLNATAPVFGMLFSALFLPLKPRPIHGFGALLGLSGVAIIVGFGPISLEGAVPLAITGCLVASMCYALVGIYMKRFAAHLDPIAMAAGGQLAASFALVPCLLFAEVPSLPSHTEILCLLTLALLCSAVAYLLYYRLIADCGPAKALTVTFLIPLFASLWGILFLGERITIEVFAGGLVVVVGIMLVLRPMRTLSTESSS